MQNGSEKAGTKLSGSLSLSKMGHWDPTFPESHPPLTCHVRQGDPQEEV